MEWFKINQDAVRRFILEDGTTVIAVVKTSEGGNRVIFYSDIPDLKRAEIQSAKLGGLSDLIDNLRPQDIIEICCRLSGTPK